MSHPIIGKLRSAIDRVVEDPGFVFILIFILVLTYLLVSATLYQEDNIDPSEGFLSSTFCLLVIGIVLRFLRPNECRFVLKHACALLILGVISILGVSLFMAILHPLQAPLETMNALALYLLIAGIVAGLLSYVLESKVIS